MVAGDFLGRGNLYDDDGALVVGLPFSMENGVYSEQTLYPIGAIDNMHDGNTTTYYRYMNSTEHACWVKWDFKRQIKFKNIKVYYNIQIGAGGGGIDINLQGSNNNINWTTIDSAATGPSSSRTGNLFGTTLKYRYIRLYTAKTEAGGTQANVYIINGTV